MSIINPVAFVQLPRILLAACLLTASLSGTARQSDRTMPIDVQADSSEFDEKTGRQTLSGSVQISQGTMLIKADVVTITLENNALRKVEGSGSPLSFEQDNESGERMRGEAREIVYDAQSGTLTLKGSASLSQPNQSLTSELITFDAETQRVTADGGGDTSNGGSRGRVSIQIQPPGSGQNAGQSDGQ